MVERWWGGERHSGKYCQYPLLGDGFAKLTLQKDDTDSDSCVSVSSENMHVQVSERYMQL